MKKKNKIYRVKIVIRKIEEPFLIDGINKKSVRKRITDFFMQTNNIVNKNQIKIKLEEVTYKNGKYVKKKIYE